MYLKVEIRIAALIYFQSSVVENHSDKGRKVLSPMQKAGRTFIFKDTCFGEVQIYINFIQYVILRQNNVKASSVIV